MQSAHEGDNLWPDSTKYMREWIWMSAHMCRLLSEPRLLVSMVKSREEKLTRSFYNPTHQAWIMKRVTDILDNPRFHQVGKPDVPGDVMIVAPYSAAVAMYKKAIQTIPANKRYRVYVRTVDTAQGHEADIVFVDLVRKFSCGFMDDPHRLNVALTRARQTEIILMNPGMLRHGLSRGRRETTYLKQVYSYCCEKRLVVQDTSYCARV